jgi:hypothetical protein
MVQLMKPWVLAVLMAGVLSTGVHAQQTLSPCKVDYVTYVHVNGINTIEGDATTNASALSYRLNRPVEIAYNRTGGKLADIWETIRQKIAEFPDLTEAELAQIAQDYSVERGETREFQKAIKKARFEKAKALGNVSLADPSMTEIRNAIDGFTPGNPPLVLLPHSQGNLYTQGVYNHLIQTKKYDPANVGVFGIASPGDYIPGANGQYVTSRQDNVISLLRLFFWNVLPGNVTISSNANDWMGHNLIEIYLNASLEALSMIQSGVKALASTFVPHSNESKATGILFAGPANTQQYNDKLGLWIQEPTGQITPLVPKNQGLFSTQSGFSIPDPASPIQVTFGPNYVLECRSMKPGQYSILTNDEVQSSRTDYAAMDIPFVFYAAGQKVEVPLHFSRVNVFSPTSTQRTVLSWTVTADEAKNQYVISTP